MNIHPFLRALIIIVGIVVGTTLIPTNFWTGALFTFIGGWNLGAFTGPAMEEWKHRRERLHD